MKPISVVRFGIVAGALAAAGLYSTTPAFAAAQTGTWTGSAAGMTFDIGQSPIGLPQSCSFPNADANFLFLSGNAVFHGTTNNNGDWGGGTMEGTAVLYEDTTAIAQGHLSVWEGGGTNVQGQNEGGLTVDFHGDGPGGTVQIHVSGHMTVNAQGQPTADVVNVNISCS